MTFGQLYNPLVRWLLRSPFHGAMSGSTMLLTYVGRRSGRRRTVPVNYLRDGETLLAVGAHGHAWWRNFRDGAAVTVRVRGHDFRGRATAFEEGAAVDEGGLLTLLRRVPQYRRHWRVTLDPSGNPSDPQALARIAAENTIVRVGGLRPGD